MSEFSIQQMKLAISYHAVLKTIEADLQITGAESRFLSGVFPKTSLIEAGFTDENGVFTKRYKRCLGEALVSIPETLALEERLAILTQVFQASLADESFAPEEGAVLVYASKLLAITADQLDVHLEQMEAVGNVDLPEPE